MPETSHNAVAPPQFRIPTTASGSSAARLEPSSEAYAGCSKCDFGDTGSGISISIFEVAANGTTIQGNYIGTDAAGTAALGNNGPGISLGGVNNTIK